MQFKQNHCYIFVVILIVLQVIGTANALRCYACTNCNDQAVQIQECGHSNNVCMKLDFGETSSKVCTRREWCNLRDIERSFGDFWNNLRNVFGQDLRDTSERVVNCCDTDLCNGAGTITNWLGLSGALALTLIVTNLLG